MARILVIDDDPGIRLMLEQVLQQAGYEVGVAADGREGVARYCERPFDLVVTDIYMPNQEGLETIKELRRRFPEVRIIAMSGRHAAGTMLSIAAKLGALETLRKPFAGDELLSVVGKVLAGPAST